ncbi:unnamed protein product [Rhizophagus irregularis]|nr:unnamed protein product [Rhizophagus irregularis]
MSLYHSVNIAIKKKGDSPSQQLTEVRLKLDDNLPTIRNELKRSDTIKIDNKLSFAKKASQSNDCSIIEFAEIAHENEINFILRDIIDEKQNILYLIESSVPDWNDKDYEESIIKEPTTINQQLIQQLKLNHGLFLNGYDIQRGKEAIFAEDGELNINLYNGQPIVYTDINDPVSPTNLLTFFNNIDSKYILRLQPSDACINFPIAEITFKSNLLESFSKCRDDVEELSASYGHIFARKTLVGGKLFIKDLSMATRTQIDLFKSHVIWAYNLAKENTNYIPDPFNFHLLPKIETLNGEKLNTPEKLADWMNNLYQKNLFDVISYDDIVPVFRLILNSLSEYKFKMAEKQPGVVNFKKKLSLEEWVGNAVYANLVKWIKDNHFLQGLIINQYRKIAKSKKIAINFIEIPNVRSSNKSYLEVIPYTNKPIIPQHIINSLYMNPRLIKSDDIIYGDCNFLVKFEQYEILIERNYIKPSKEFEHDINVALNNMKPFKALQDVFEEYGHFFPQKITLGRSLKKNITHIPHIYLDEKETGEMSAYRIDLKPPIFESLKLYLNDLNISYLLTQKENIVEQNELPDLMQNLSNLEIIEMDGIISLHKLLDIEQQRKVDIILNNNNEVQDNNKNYKIIMTGITNLKDLNNENSEHYKRIEIEPPLDDDNYEVFGSIISKNNLKLEEFLVKFRLYDFNGFSAMIKTLRTDNIITECFLLWVIVGNPSVSSVFSPKNRDLQIDYIKELKIDRNEESYYLIQTPSPLSQGCCVFVNAYYSSTTYEPLNVKSVILWKRNQIMVNIEPIEPAMDYLYFNICIIPSDYKTIKIDREEKDDKDIT